MALNGIEVARSDRLRTLGVRESAIEASSVAQSAAKASVNHLRVLQWNLLADGLADDGFLVGDVLADWPAGKGNLPEVSGDSACLVDVAQQLTDARGQPAEVLEVTLKDLAARFNTPASRVNFAAVVDWQARASRIEAEIVANDPDIIALQELDHFQEMGTALSKHGYECGLPGALQRYTPASNEKLLEGDAEAYLKHLRDAGLAFAPNLPSNARKSAMKEGKVDADDDGVAIFWKQSSLELKRLEYFTYPSNKESRKKSKLKGAVKAVLAFKDGGEVHIITAHLASGDSVEEERQRVQQELLGSACVLASNADASAPCQGLKEWFAKSISQTPTVFALDANATPEISKQLDVPMPTVWQVLRGIAGVASVWDEWYESDGTRRGGAPEPLPVSTNKLRGPLSAQPRKIGLHAHYLIDHVYFGASRLKLAGHVRKPLGHSSARAALAELLPTLNNPSDHVPIIVDLEFCDAAEPAAKRAKLTGGA